MVGGMAHVDARFLKTILYIGHRISMKNVLDLGDSDNFKIVKKT